jgi:hypothetical protein
MSRLDGIVTVIALLAPLSIVLRAAHIGKPEQGQSFKVPNHGQLLLSVPNGWKQSVQQPPIPNLPPTIKFSAMDGQFEMLVTPLWARDGNRNFTSPQNVRKLAEAQGNRMLSGSKEQSLDLQEIKGEKASGYYFTLTDKSPDPGSYEYMTGAFVGVGDLLLSITMLHHQKDVPPRQAGLAMLKSASQQKGADASEKQSADLRISSAGAGWELVLPKMGLDVVDDQTDEAHKARRLMASNESGLTVSVLMEPAQKAGDSTAARAVYWGRGKDSPIPKKNIKLAKTGDIATVEYMVGEVEGVPLNQKNMNLYIAHEGTWIDIHISKTGFTQQDQALFDQIAKGVRFDVIAVKR